MGTLDEVTEDRIQKTIQSFDICSLIKLLFFLGYSLEDLYFVSSNNFASAKSLCEAIHFVKDPSSNRKKVEILLNVGFLTSNSPLPSFFLKKMDEQQINTVGFTRFLNFFDHIVIKNYIARSLQLMTRHNSLDWQSLLKQYVQMTQVASLCSLEHLFQVCYPEMRVHVVKSYKLTGSVRSSTRLGNAALGDKLFLGQKIQASHISFSVYLYVEEERTDRNIPWPVEVKRRLKELVYPLVARAELHFKLFLVIQDLKYTYHLTKDTYLGYSCLGKNEKDLTLFLFSGSSAEIPQHL